MIENRKPKTENSVSNGISNWKLSSHYRRCGVWHYNTTISPPSKGNRAFISNAKKDIRSIQRYNSIQFNWIESMRLNKFLKQHNTDSMCIWYIRIDTSLASCHFWLLLDVYSTILDNRQWREGEEKDHSTINARVAVICVHLTHKWLAIMNILTRKSEFYWQ